MKTTLLLATGVLVGTGAMGIRAGSTAALEGAPALATLTRAMLAACPGAAGGYVSGSSAGGQAAMLAARQQVAPMSRFLDANACTSSSRSASQGLVIGLDSVVLVGDESTFASTDCNGHENLSCLATFEPVSGAAYDTPVVVADGSTYTFEGWQDVLRVLLAGLHHDVHGVGPQAWMERDCNSPVRQALAQDYGLFFENHCGATSGEPPGDATFSPACREIRHVFRLGDAAEATETMVTLLDLPGIVAPETPVDGVVQHTGASPFCNAVRPAFVYASPHPTTLRGADFTWDPTSKNVAPNGRETSVYSAPMQDNDPIRRRCAGTGVGPLPAEDVCSHSGDLGLVLPINDVDEPPLTTADGYNAEPCVRARLAEVAPPEVYDAVTQVKITCARGLLCPNGDVCNSLGGCYAPAAFAGNPNCLANRLTTPAFTVSRLAMPLANPRVPSLNDGRSYNQHLYTSAGSYRRTSATRELPVTGAYHRIHTAHSLTVLTEGEAPITCQRANASDQIGCLVSASPCSLGYTERRALTSTLGIGAIKINRQSPAATCMQDHFRYPLTRKVYWSALVGFAAVDGQELQLSGCMTGLVQASHVPSTPAGLLTTSLVAAGLVPLPTSVNHGEPYCEDFNEAALCGAASNVDACRNRPANFANFPSMGTVCGDGRVDDLEDCDDGAANGDSPATCSRECRFHR